MTRSQLARILLYFSLCLSCLWAAELPARAIDVGTPDLECGDYRVSGRLRQNSVGQFVLIVRDGSTSAHELVVLGGDVRGKLRALNAGVALDVYVPRPIRSNQSPFVFAQGSLTPSVAFHEAPRLLRSAECGLKDRLRPG